VARALEEGATSLLGAMVPGSTAAPADLGLKALVGRVVQSPLALPVVDGAGNYLGAVTQTQLLQRFAQDEVAHV
jgi:CBS-domain-containing membrane protein